MSETQKYEDLRVEIDRMKHEVSEWKRCAEDNADQRDVFQESARAAIAHSLKLRDALRKIVQWSDAVWDGHPAKSDVIAGRAALGEGE